MTEKRVGEGVIARWKMFTPTVRVEQKNKLHGKTALRKVFVFLCGCGIHH